MIRKLSAAGRVKKKTAVARRLKVPLVLASSPANPLQMVLRAASFAARKHQGQTRADNLTPYFSHVARVTLILSHVFGVQDESILAAALLHDTVEDTPTSREELVTVFGERVADIVMLLTKDIRLPKKEREEEYIARLLEAPEDVMIAKMADLYDNLSDRVHSPKLPKTAATAERLLSEFGERLETPTGLAAHEKLGQLLDEVKALQAADVSSGRSALASTD